MNLAASALRRDDSGVSLVEVTLSVALLGLLLAAIGFTFASVNNTFLDTVERQANLSEAQVIMDNVSKDLRTATRIEASGSPFVQAEDFDVIFYANLHPSEGPRHVRLSVNGDNELEIRIKEPDSGSAPNFTYSGPNTTRVLGSNLANTSSEPLFTYLDADSNELSTPLDSSGRAQVRSVTLNVHVAEPDTPDVPGSHLTNTVRLPNTHYENLDES